MSTRVNKQALKRTRRVLNLDGFETPPKKVDKKSAHSEKIEINCPVCLTVIVEACMLACGHSFCRECICRCLQDKLRCPVCEFVVESKTAYYPNFALDSAIRNYQKVTDLASPTIEKVQLARMKTIDELLLDPSAEATDLSRVISMLQAKHDHVIEQQRISLDQLMSDFLADMHAKRKRTIEALRVECDSVKEDLDHIERKVREQQRPGSSMSGKEVNAQPSEIALRRKRIHQHFDDLESSYLDCKISSDRISSSDDSLHFFGQRLRNLVRYESVKTIACLNYSNDPATNAIVSSIEFDRDDEFMAIGGVIKRIKIYDYATVLVSKDIDMFPVCELNCQAKISAVSFNSFMKNRLAASDYEGTVTIWDVARVKRESILREHEKRCWTVDFAKTDYKILASGSDDCKVKVWSMDSERSMTTISSSANVCCVHFHPNDFNQLAISSADHNVYIYDLRHPKQALSTLRGHEKAVSYVRYCSKSVLASLSAPGYLSWFFSFCTG